MARFIEIVRREPSSAGELTNYLLAGHQPGVDLRFEKKIARYLARSRRAREQQLASLHFESWFDYWHMHPDLRFRSNRIRRLADALTYKLLLQTEQRAEPYGDALQAWAQFHPNTGDNAVYLHSANPNGSPFPYEFDNVTWGTTCEALKGLVDEHHEIGSESPAGIPDKTYCIVRRRA